MDTAATVLSNFFYYYFYYLRSLSTRLEAGKDAPLTEVEELGLGFVVGWAPRLILTPLSKRENADQEELEEGLIEQPPRGI